MVKVISIVNQKGGTGKTTTTVNLGAYLAALGKKTLLVDLDPQANSSSHLGISTEEDNSTLYEVLSGDISLKEAIKNTSVFNYDVALSSPNLAGATVELVEKPEREYLLDSALEGVKESYDYILIDSPPSLGILTVNGLVASDEIIIPIQCEYFALEGLGQLLNTIDLVNDNLEKEIKIKGALLTMFDRRNKLSKSIIKEMKRNFPYHVFDTIIPRNVVLAESPSYGQSIIQYDPYSHGAKAYRQFAQEIVKIDYPNENQTKEKASNRNKKSESLQENPFSFYPEIKTVSENDFSSQDNLDFDL